LLLSRDIASEAKYKLKLEEITDLVTDLSYIPGKCCVSLLDALLEAADLPSGGFVEATGKGNALVGPTLAEGTPTIESDQARFQGATKADDAEIPMHLWGERLLPDLPQPHRSKIFLPICQFALRWWRRSVLRDFLQWFKKEYSSLGGVLNITCILRHKEARMDWLAGKDCIQRCAYASWWQWDSGSRPFHWRWLVEHRTIIRDGLPPMFISKLPLTTIPQKGEPDVDIRIKIKDKLNKVLAK
jgi:hypothetical protein